MYTIGPVNYGPPLDSAVPFGGGETVYSRI